MFKTCGRVQLELWAALPPTTAAAAAAAPLVRENSGKRSEIQMK